MARKKDQVADWLDGVRTVEAPAVEQVVAPTKRRRRIAKAIVYSAIILGGLMGLVALSLMLSDDTDDGTNTMLVTAPGRADAEAAMRWWLAEQAIVDTPIPTWVSATDTFTDPDTGDVQWLHMFDVLAADGGRYMSSVNVVIPADGGRAVVAGVPSLWAIDPTPDSPNATATVQWPGTTSRAPSESVTRAVGAWARAYTGASPSELRLAVGDRDPDHHYAVLGQRGQLDDFRVTAGALFVEGDDEPDPTVMVATVQLAFSDGTEDAEQTIVSIDVLIIDADTASPRVVAWGGVGTGHMLSPYSNALTYELSDLKREDTPTGDTTSDGDSDDAAGDDPAGEEDQS